ncbi:MAG: hypothetical protein P8Y69_10705 [Gammaproteobacteria bacterium]
MLNRVDRIQMTAVNASAVADRWCALLDGKRVGEDVVEALAAQRVTVHLGDSMVEVLEPTGPGIAQDHFDRGSGGPLALGVTTDDLGALKSHLAALDIGGIDIDGQLFLGADDLGIPGLSVVVSPEEVRSPVGLMRNLYEATHLTEDAQRSTGDIARVFGLDASAFVPIRSEQYGYDGTLTLFNAERLDRVETIHPFDETKTMGRFFKRFGPSLYMCYGETDDLTVLRERVKSMAPQDWTGSDENDDGLFIHPRALGGVMLGVSRTSHAWTWSGYPERRLPLPGD